MRSPAEVETYDAVALFVGRARRVRPDFTLTRSNAAAVVDICRRLDGNPLALQLAASRVGVLTPAQSAELLEDRFNLLTTGDPSGPARHRTLRAAASWSYSLLSDEERALFDRLAVFAGGFTLEAAAAIANGPRGPGADDAGAGSLRPAAVTVLDILASLKEKSLIVVDAGEGGAAKERSGTGAPRRCGSTR